MDLRDRGPALGDRWDVISKWREGAIFGFAKHCVYTIPAQHPFAFAPGMQWWFSI